MTTRTRAGIALPALTLALVACGGASPDAPGAADRVSIDAAPLAEAPQGGTNSPYCERAAAAQTGVEEVGRRALSERTWEIELASQAMQRSEFVNVMFPVGYDASGHTRYPVLFLLHGALDNHLAWWANGAEEVVGERPMIVVMPNDSGNGSYSDWYGTLAGSGETAPHWESFHIREVIPWVKAHLPVRSDAAGWTVAGLSSGGHGAMKYAAAYPGLFGSAGAFSGAVDTTYNFPQGSYSYPLTQTALDTTSLIPTQGPAHHCTFGDPVIQEAYWRDHNPTYLAQNLAGIPLWLSTGDGTPGAYDAAPYADPVELQVYYMTLSFIGELDRYAIAHTDDLYGAGTHSWPYWRRDLGLFLNWAQPLLARELSVPESFAYRSARPAFAAWDWHFAIHRDVQEFVYLSEVSSRGLQATGSGLLDVLTAPLYAPGAVYVVASDGATTRIAASPQGRLSFSVDLGPAHDEHQRDFSDAAAAAWRSVRVDITPVR